MSFVRFFIVFQFLIFILGSATSFECYECSKSEDGNKCKKPDKFKTCEDKEGCITYISEDGSVFRGCGLASTCDDKKDCSYSSDDKSNDKIFYDCLKCGPEDPKCKDDKDLEGIKTCLGSACYKCMDPGNQNVTRDCTDPKNNKLKCEKCEGDKCSPKENFSCYKCNSAEKSECAQWPKEGIEGEKCSTDEDECFIMIQDGNTMRGCSKKSEEKCKNNSEMCHTCSTQNCNSGVFPENRLKCHQCKETEDCAKPKQNTESACKVYDPNDECYTYSKNNTEVMLRGCISDKTDCNEIETCISCNVTGCNDLPFKIDSSLKCIQCNETNEKCVWAQNENTAIACQEQHKFYEKEYCYSLKLENSTGERGCLPNTNIKCPDDSTECKKCSDSGCNKEQIIDYGCIRCGDNIPGQEFCGSEIKGIPSTKCHNPVSYDSRGCYTDKIENVVRRGCLIDLNDVFRNQCQDKDFKFCVTCLESGCNTKMPPNSATFNNLPVILWIFSICSFVKYLV